MKLTVVYGVPGQLELLRASLHLDDVHRSILLSGRHGSPTSVVFCHLGFPRYLFIDIYLNTCNKDSPALFWLSYWLFTY